MRTQSSPNLSPSPGITALPPTPHPPNKSTQPSGPVLPPENRECGQEGSGLNRKPSSPATSLRLVTQAAGGDGPHRLPSVGSQVALVVKNLPASAEDIGVVSSIPGSGRSPGAGRGNPLQYSCLENSMDRAAWRAVAHRVAQSRTRLK